MQSRNGGAAQHAKTSQLHTRQTPQALCTATRLLGAPLQSHASCRGRGWWEARTERGVSYGGDVPMHT